MSGLVDDICDQYAIQNHLVTFVKRSVMTWRILSLPAAACVNDRWSLMAAITCSPQDRQQRSAMELK
jgi:hypothetical protein